MSSVSAIYKGFVTHHRLRPRDHRVRYRVFSLLLDLSKSMSFGSKGLTKLTYASYLGACLAYMAQRQRDRVGMD